jgi:DNA sulfur modification protein DndC
MERVARLPIYCHVVCPEIEQRFWVCLLGKGYPPPHQRFRWCTRRLKIEPVEDALKSFVKPGKTLILTGVRFGESRARDARLHQSCGRGGECGQGVWFQFSSRLQAAYMAPIVEWGECDVWDFLQFHAPALGYPTRHIEDSIYNGRETRFGCWICTVVRQDRTMEKITALLQWSHLRPLLDFRQRVKELTSRPESRLIRPDGKPGRLTLAVRRQLLDELLKLQTTVGIEIVSPDEIVIIQKYWEKEVS